MKRKDRLTLVLAIIFLLLAQGPLSAQTLDEENQVMQKPAPGRLDLDVKDVDIRDIARMLSRISGLNIIVSDDVVAKVTFRGTNVDWETALNIILKTYNLTVVREGDFLRIITYDKLRREEEGIPLTTEVIFLNFAKACNIVSAIDSLRSGRGRIATDATTNSLIITDTPDRIEGMLVVINELDKRTPQVMIEALMVDVKLSVDDQIGINWTVIHKERPERQFSQVLGITEEGSTGGTAAAGVIRYGKTLLTHANLSALINVWCQTQKAEILANPKVLTLDGLTANIELVEQVPYIYSTISTETGAITSTVSFKDAGIKLYVTPHISVEGFVSLNIRTEQSFRTGTIGGQPIIDSRKAETNLLVKDNETIVIGGLRKKNLTKTTDKIPILGSIPFLGKLFQRNVKTISDTELLIFVTPYIIKETKLTEEEKKQLEKFRVPQKLKISKESVFPLRPPAEVK